MGTRAVTSMSVMRGAGHEVIAAPTRPCISKVIAAIILVTMASKSPSSCAKLLAESSFVRVGDDTGSVGRSVGCLRDIEDRSVKSCDVIF